MKGQTFRRGHILSTAGALAAFMVNRQSPQGFLQRHLSGDWGDLDQEDKQRNEQAVTNGTRLLSAYQLNDARRSGLSPKLTARRPRFFCRRSISRWSRRHRSSAPQRCTSS